MIVGHIGGGSVGVDTGDIGHSLRCRSSGSTYLSRTFGTPASSSIWTFSLWVKRGAITGTYRLLGASTTTYLTFNSSDQLNLTLNGVSACTSAAVYRDPAATLHIVYLQNGSAQTLYVNNTSVATGTTAASIFNTAIVHQIGAANTTNHFDGYISRVVFVDGQALTPSSFGYLNTEINEWVTKTQSQVKAVVDAGGTNSFMLDFDDGTSLTTLGYDKSSKGNNWTLNNFSLTAGTSYDWMLDVPGNSFATLNPIVASAANISNANLTSGTTAVRGTMNALLFNCKWEVTAGGSAVTAGVISGTGTTNTISVTANKTFAFRLTTAGALDYKNVTDAGSWTSIATGLTDEQFPYSVTQSANWNFGQAPLHASATYQADNGGYFYDTTSGYKALCQANLPDPAVLDPTDHHYVVTVTKSGNTNFTIPWNADTYDTLFKIKRRDAAGSWYWVDGLRGYDKYLSSNSTSAETTDANVLGISGTTGTLKSTLADGTYVVFMWKAGLSASRVTNTSGSITSTVSANTTAGFSIVTYTGSGANATVGHSVGRELDHIVVKNRTTTARDWPIWNHNLTSGAYVVFQNTTAAQSSSATVWNSTTPTDSVFSVGTATTTNTNTDNYVAYCFAEISGYSKFGTSSGNGSSDGPFEYCNFKPQTGTIKKIDSVSIAGGVWTIVDTARSAYNIANEMVKVESNSLELSIAELDIVSNGIKYRGASTNTSYDHNISGATSIYELFAETTGKYANAR